MLYNDLPYWFFACGRHIQLPIDSRPSHRAPAATAPCGGGTAGTHQLNPNPRLRPVHRRPGCGWRGCSAPAHPNRPLTTLLPPCPTLAAWQRSRCARRPERPAALGRAGLAADRPQRLLHLLCLLADDGKRHSSPVPREVTLLSARFAPRRHTGGACDARRREARDGVPRAGGMLARQVCAQ